MPLEPHAASWCSPIYSKTRFMAACGWSLTTIQSKKSFQLPVGLELRVLIGRPLFPQWTVIGIHKFWFMANCIHLQRIQLNSNQYCNHWFHLVSLYQACFSMFLKKGWIIVAWIFENWCWWSVNVNKNN